MQPLQENALLALDTIMQKETKGIPTSFLNVMEHNHIERIAGAQPGDYKRDPERIYMDMQYAIGACLLDQYIPDNPLSMGSKGYEGAVHGALTGAEEIMLDGMAINSPESVVEHLEKFVFPRIQQAIRSFDEDAQVHNVITMENGLQEKLGPSILKSGYAFVTFPIIDYYSYGYVNYFCAYAMYPEVMERHFSLQADYALLINKAAARAYKEANLPPLYRLDHDIADSRGTLVNVKSLDEIWFPHFARCLEPMLKTDVKMIWHCDGNLMEMVPRLIDVGIRGFQGFQYEDGMDYEKICRMKTNQGDDLIIIGGVSVTRTLPMGSPSDVKREIEWLVNSGPDTGLFLAGSSSIAPGVSWENMEVLIEGFKYYRTHGRS
ncbi:MAG: uroporphyrinogen decarboxylase family protein [Armatimonadota bacterium]